MPTLQTLCRLIAALLVFHPFAADAQTTRHDVVVYGGTSAGIAAAVQAKRMGKSVVVVSPDEHIGGLSSNGLGWTDTGNKAVIGGIAREFYGGVYDHYQRPEAWRWESRDDYGNVGQGTPAIDGDKRTMWIFEPHVAEAVFESWVRRDALRVDRNRRLDRENGVEMADNRIVAITTLDGHTYRGTMFIDATYEGDLMAAAGVDYTVGRESNSTYGEKWNGVQTGVLHHEHHFGVLNRPVDPYVVKGDPGSGVIPKVSPEPPGDYGSADHRVQAYCYRLCMTDHPENRIPFPRPEGYDPAQFELMGRILEAGWLQVLRKFDPIPNRKTDTNNHGPMSSDNIGMNYDYPEASYERRAEILDEHRRYQQGWLYFMCTDPRVPKSLQDELNRWGLSRDEFADNGHWPYQIYVREARRMVADLVMTEGHVLGEKPIDDSIGMGSYVMDSHNVQRYITPEGYVQNEGDIGVDTPGPYRIGYGSIVPKSSQCENLLVPVCLSSSHIAFGSIRMEPVFMILAQSAATAACLAIDQTIAVQQVDYQQLKSKLIADGQVLETPADVLQALAVAAKAAASRSMDTAGIKGIVIDDARAELSGSWQTSTASNRFVGPSYRHDGDHRNGLMSARFTTTILTAGRYDVRIAYPYGNNRATNVPVDVSDGSQTYQTTLNQRQEPQIDGIFQSLGQYDFDAGQSVTVTITNAGTDGYVVADAVVLVRQ